MLRLYTKFQGMKYNASTYYRLVLPLQLMEKLYKDEVTAILDPADDQINDDERWNLMCAADILFTYQLIEPRFLGFMHYLRSIPPAADEGGELRQTPSFVATTDDDIFAVPPLNPAFSNLGWSVDGVTPLPETADPEAPTTVSIKNAVTGTRMPLWVDGHNGFDIARNKKNLEGWRNILREAEAVIVSNPRLGERIIEETGQPDKNIIVFPNCVDFSIYPKVDLRPHPEEIRILYQGSTTHHEDLWPLREAFHTLSEKYPNVKWFFWGVNYKWALDQVPEERREFVGWVPYWAYPTKLMTIGHDIAIAPLSPSRFNQSRTAIKWYEGTAAGAAVCAQRTGAYADEIVDGETGMLFDTPEQFVEQMSKLIESAELRKKLVENSTAWLKEHRDPETNVRELYAKLKAVREARAAWGDERREHYKRLYDEAVNEPVPAVGDQPASGEADRPRLVGPDGQ